MSEPPPEHDAAEPAAVETDSEQMSAAEPDLEPEWWDNPSMPWKHKPTRTDFACMGWIGFMGVFGLAMLPLRSWLLGLNPWLLASLTGSRSGTAALGALVRVGEANNWIIALLLGTVMSIKFDWVFWWAGKLWGRGMIEVWAGQSPRSARNYARAERWANRFGWLGMFLAYVPIPLPIMQVVFVLTGAQGWSLRRFILLDAAASFTWSLGFLALGYGLGEPAVELLRMYARIANYVAIALIVVIVVGAMRRGRTTRNSSDKARPAE